MQNCYEASPSVNLAGLALLVKMLISQDLFRMVYFYQILLAYTFLHCLENKDEASPSISAADHD